jgi:hypothetical protein
MVPQTAENALYGSTAAKTGGRDPMPKTTPKKQTTP